MAAKSAKREGPKGTQGKQAKQGKTVPVATNRRARHEYEILETVEAGISLIGPEVKSVREGRVNLREAYGTVRRGEVFLSQCHIAPYEPATRANPSDPMRERKLLLHRGQIRKLAGRVSERGMTLVPLSIYFVGGRAKVELALARGKHTYDKRAALRKREDDEAAQRALRARGGAYRR